MFINIKMPVYNTRHDEHDTIYTFKTSFYNLIQ